MTANPQAVEAFTKWLTEFPRTSLTQRHAQLGEARFQIARSYLAVKNVTKFSDLSEDEQLALCYAVGLTVPGPVVKMDIQPGTFVKATMDLDGSNLRVQPVQPYGAMDKKAVTEAKRIPYDDLPAATKLQVKRAELQVKRQARIAAEFEAADRGELWTIVVAYEKDVTSILMHHGYPEDEEGWNEDFQRRYPAAAMFLEPTHMIGTLSEIRGRVAQQFVGTSKAPAVITVETEESK